MSIDRLLEDLKEEEIITNKIPDTISERCWENIKTDIKRKQRWYDKALLSLRNLNKRYHVKLAFEIALLILVAISMPTIVKQTKNFVQNSAWFNGNKQEEPKNNKNPENKDNKITENTNKDGNYVKALEKIRTIAQEKYKKFTIYSDEKLVNYPDYFGNYYSFTIFENAEGNNTPTTEDTFLVNDSNLQVISRDGGKSVNQYFAEKQIYYLISGHNSEDIKSLINKVDNLNIGNSNDVDFEIQIYSKSDESSKLNIPDGAYYYPKQPNIYYTYDYNKDELYKHSTSNEKGILIYKYNPNEFSVLTDVKKADLDGDGKEDVIKYDPMRGIVSINDVSICTGMGYLYQGLQIVDINKDDNQKEVFIQNVFPSDQRINNILMYRNGLISLLTREGGEPLISGDGVVTFMNILSQFFQTHGANYEYKYDNDGRLKKVEQELYDSKISDENGNMKDQIIKCKKALHLYKEKGSTEVAAVLKVGEEVKVIGYDENEWVLLENSQGVRGWIQVNGAQVKELNLFSGDVFDGLNFAS